MGNRRRPRACAFSVSFGATPCEDRVTRLMGVVLRGDSIEQRINECGVVGEMREKSLGVKGSWVSCRF